jgi:hypothetical protein
MPKHTCGSVGVVAVVVVVVVVAILLFDHIRQRCSDGTSQVLTTTKEMHMKL